MSVAPTALTTAKTAACIRCGERFRCDPAGDCWCKDLPPIHPVPSLPSGCFCSRCLDAIGDEEKPRA